MKGERRKRPLQRKFWFEGRLVSLPQIILLEMGRRNGGRVQYWMINIIKEMGYNGKTSKVFASMIKNGYLDESWRVTEEGYKLIKMARTRFGSELEEIMNCVFAGEYDKALKIWQYL